MLGGGRRRGGRRGGGGGGGGVGRRSGGGKNRWNKIAERKRSWRFIYRRERRRENEKNKRKGIEEREIG